MPHVPEMEDFSFLPFEEMSPEDYQKIGFMGGLEVHQQLNTAKKLFCRCPSGRFSKEFHAEILRHMRPTLSELGAYDGTALMEFKTAKNITYHINRATTCTYEMDDTPPFEINDDALDKALAIGLFFGSSIVDELHIARKQYLDGSIPTGFQRTAIYCLNGKVPFIDRMIDISQMSIEEDSCRELKDEHHERHYNTDRLGMPLIETVTAPQVRTPQEMAALCNLLRYAVRATGLVRTGQGASREDVNVSVRGGTRIEIKGVPSVKAIPRLCYNEAMRQWNLLKIKKELDNRGIKKVDYASGEVSNLISKTKAAIIRKALKENGKAVAVKLSGFGGILKHPTQTNTTFSREFSDRLCVIACLSDQPNMDNSDDREILEKALWKTVCEKMGAEESDAVILIWGNKTDVDTAVKEIVIRAEESIDGVPSETRQALDDGTNGFERILPGSDRMYPDTDLPPKPIESERLRKLRSLLPVDYWHDLGILNSAGLPVEICGTLSTSPYLHLAAQLVDEGVDKNFIVQALYDMPVMLKRQHPGSPCLNADKVAVIVRYVVKNELPADAILLMYQSLIENGDDQEIEFPGPATEAEMDKALAEASGRWAEKKIHHNSRKEELITATAKNILFGRVHYNKLLLRMKETRVHNG